MVPVVVIFVDSLMPESVEYMDFLNSLNIARIQTELPSYSNTCLASAYTGVYPNKHKHFFIWRYSPNTSPFKLMRVFSRVKLHRIFMSKYLKLMLFATICKLKRGVIPFRSFLLERSVDYWSNFDFSMIRYWGKPDMYIGKYPTIFKLLNDAGIKYYLIYEVKGKLKRINKMLNKIKLTNFTKPSYLIYIFLGHIDTITHFHGQTSLVGRIALKQLDKFIESIYSRFERSFNDDFLILIFSDHGQAMIRERINLHSIFRSKKKWLNDYIAIIDSCYARFWFRNEQEKKEVEIVLRELEDKGMILTHDYLRRYHAEMPKDQGELIFLLEKSRVFEEATNRKYAFMHGYSPDNPELDGLCALNKKILRSRIRLQDIAPSILKALYMKIPEYMDGGPIWR